MNPSPEIFVAKADYSGYYDGHDGFIVRRKDAIAAGIRWFESGWNKFDADKVVPSHAFKILKGDQTIEAFSHGVDYGSLRAYVEDPNVAVFVRKPILLSTQMIQGFIQDAPSELGKKYNFGLIACMAGSNSRLGAVMDAIFGKRRFTHWIDSKGDSTRLAICSQSTARLDNNRPELHNKGCLAWDADQEEVKPIDLFTDLEIYNPGALELVP